MLNKTNFNKTIRDKEKKVLEYFSKKTNIELIKIQKPIHKRTKKNIPTQIPKTDIENKNKIEKLTKTK